MAETKKANRGCGGCLGSIIGLVIIVVIIAAIAGGSSSSSGNSPTSSPPVPTTTEHEQAPPPETTSTPEASSSGQGSESSNESSGGEEDEVGSYSHAGDTKFCEEHECIGDFTSEPGKVVECGDGTYSHSGGISGACSDHGGVKEE